MDNIRSVIHLLFAKQDVKKLLSQVKDSGKNSGDNIVSREDFKNLFISSYTRYSGNQLNSLFDITNDEWSTNKILGGSNRNVVNVLTHVTDSMLAYKGGKPYCKYDEYLRWHELTKVIGEDILVTSYLSAMDIVGNVERTNFNWDPYLLSDNKELQYHIDKGLAELHYHLYGSSLIFTINWLAVMNHPCVLSEKKFNQLTGFTDGYLKVLVAAFIRSVLYAKLNDNLIVDVDELFDDFDKEDDKYLFAKINLDRIQGIINILSYATNNEIDYAMPTDAEVLTQLGCRKYIVGERKFLYDCFTAINRGVTNPVFNNLFYLYLIIKTQFRNAMLQVNNVIGFENFQNFNRTKLLFIKNIDGLNSYNSAFNELSACISVQGMHVQYIEYRINPSNTIEEMQTHINSIDDLAESNEGVIYGYIFHFTKNKENRKYYINSIYDGLICRNSELRRLVWNQKNYITQMLNKGGHHIFGVDAAGSEFNARPEVFGPTFRSLKNFSSYNIGITYHVGEDFYDVVDGLRAIDEAIIFLNLSNGDRIGHGTALGIDVRHYYDQKYHTITMPKQVLLDNMAWLMDKVKKYGINDDSGFMYSVEHNFFELSSEIFGSAVDIQQYIEAWLLRGDDPESYRETENEPHRSEMFDLRYKLNDDNRVAVARHNKDVRKLYYRYHYEFEAKSKGSKSTEWKIETCHRASFVRILETIQEKMQEEIARRHIAIECNPTSNLRIGNIPRYVEHPIVKFNNEDLIRTDGKVDKSAQISVSINTDDAGIFATSLEKEFTLMALALEKETTKDGEPKYQQRSVYRWLENIRENAFIQKFGE